MPLLPDSASSLKARPSVTSYTSVNVPSPLALPAPYEPVPSTLDETKTGLLAPSVAFLAKNLKRVPDVIVCVHLIVTRAVVPLGKIFVWIAYCPAPVAFKVPPEIPHPLPKVQADVSSKVPLDTLLASNQNCC